MIRKLLVVEDEPDIVEALVWALKHAWSIEAAFDCDSALAMFAQGDFNAAIVDLNLPGLDGAEVIRRLRGRHPQLPVVLASASPDVDRIAKAVGANAWLSKPFDVDHLEFTLESVVERR